MKPLPRFVSRNLHQVQSLAARVLTGHEDEQTHLVQLLHYDDRHYRAIFHPDYFALQPGHEAPTRSQWNSLKKKFKRYDRSIFVFKETGETSCPDGPYRCYYIDFGFVRPF